MTVSPVTSSFLKAIGRDPKTGIVQVHFKNGKVYQSVNRVPAAHFRAWLNAESVGTHFNTVIRGKHRHEFEEFDLETEPAKA